MTQDADTIFQDDYSLGSVLDVAPHLIPGNGAYRIVNATLEEDGSPTRRGGTAYKSNAGFGASGLRFIWDGYLSVGLRTLFANPQNFGVLADDDATPINLGIEGVLAPVMAVELAGLLFIGGGYVYGGSRKTANYGAGSVAVTKDSKTVTGTGTAFLDNVDPGMLFQRHSSERVYVVESVQTNTALILAEAYEGETGSGVSSYLLRRLYKLTEADPYPVAPFYAVCANRLVYAKDNKLHSSEHLKPHLWTATIGQPPNDKQVPTVHELPKGARIMGLGSIGDTLLAFTTQGLWVVEGLAFDIVSPDGNPQHRVQEFSGERLVNSTGIARWEQTLVVPAVDGIYLIDGVSQPQKISTSIDPLYRHYIQTGYRPGGATAHRDHYLLPIVDVGGNVKDLLVCRLDRPVERRGQVVYPWTFFAEEGGDVTAFSNHIHDDVPRPQLIGADGTPASRVLDCTHYFSPDSQHGTDASGAGFDFDVVTRDFETGGGTLNVVRNMRARYVFRSLDNPDLECMEFSYATGDVDPTHAHWGNPDGIWGEGFGPPLDGQLQPWTSSSGVGIEGSAFTLLSSGMPDTSGTTPHRARVNKTTRFIRFRARCKRPASLAKLRSIQAYVRPAGSRRR